MLKALVGALSAVSISCGPVNAAIIDFSDGIYTPLITGPGGTVRAFQEVVEGVTFNFFAGASFGPTE